jgi:type III secretory pathway component EscU
MRHKYILIIILAVFILATAIHSYAYQTTALTWIGELMLILMIISILVGIMVVILQSLVGHSLFDPLDSIIEEKKKP